MITQVFWSNLENKVRSQYSATSQNLLALGLFVDDEADYQYIKLSS